MAQFWAGFSLCSLHCVALAGLHKSRAFTETDLTYGPDIHIKSMDEGG